MPVDELPGDESLENKSAVDESPGDEPPGDKPAVDMARAYLTEKQVPRNYWFHAVQHACRMMNQIPSKVSKELTTSFKLVHHIPPDTRTWFPLFSIVFFYKQTDEDQDCTSF